MLASAFAFFFALCSFYCKRLDRHNCRSGEYSGNWAHPAAPAAAAVASSSLSSCFCNQQSIQYYHSRSTEHRFITHLPGHLVGIFWDYKPQVKSGDEIKFQFTSWPRCLAMCLKLPLFFNLAHISLELLDDVPGPSSCACSPSPASWNIY